MTRSQAVRTARTGLRDRTTRLRQSQQDRAINNQTTRTRRHEQDSKNSQNREQVSQDKTVRTGLSEQGSQYRDRHAIQYSTARTRLD